MGALPVAPRRATHRVSWQSTIAKGHRDMRRTTICALSLIAGLSVVAAACGSSTPAATASSTTTAAPSSAIAPISMPSPAGTWGKEPSVSVPIGRPPTVLESADLIVGTGPAAKAGDTVSVQYVLVDYATEKVLQASWTSNMPFSFTLGEGQVIKGWDEGVVGMKAGGRRELIIPPALAYGSSPPSGIEPNATLIFVIDLLKIG
jgi:peptidylprolyl isomerase